MQRNYIKRVMKEWFRLNQHLVTGNKTYDLWIVVKRRFDKHGVQEIHRLLKNALETIDARKQKISDNRQVEH